METLGDKIKKFLTIDDDNGYGGGEGYGYGSCDGDGNDSSDGDIYGSGYGCGSGSGDGTSYASGSGYGYGKGEAYSSGQGDAYGFGDTIKEINGREVYTIDGIQTIIMSVRDNVAQGFILQIDLQTKPCFIVKENNKFAHGDTLRDAFASLQEKLYDNSTEEERIEAFKEKFPSYDTKYDNQDLFTYHHVLTGSCRMGRESFVADKGLSLDGKTTVREFVKLTKNAYGGEVIKKLPKAYGITD